MMQASAGAAWPEHKRKAGTRVSVCRPEAGRQQNCVGDHACRLVLRVTAVTIPALSEGRVMRSPVCRSTAVRRRPAQGYRRFRCRTCSHSNVLPKRTTWVANQPVAKRHLSSLQTTVTTCSAAQGK